MCSWVSMFIYVGARDFSCLEYKWRCHIYSHYSLIVRETETMANRELLSQQQPQNNRITLPAFTEWFLEISLRRMRSETSENSNFYLTSFLYSCQSNLSSSIYFSTFVGNYRFAKPSIRSRSLNMTKTHNGAWNFEFPTKEDEKIVRISWYIKTE